MARKKQPAQPRGKGRPQNAGQVVGRERLIAATRELLRKKAPSKITRLDVANEAGVDPALVRYYFGDRDTLLLEAAREITQEIVADSRSGIDSAHTPSEMLARWVKNHALMHAHNPNMHQLLLELVVAADKPRSKALRREFTEAAQQDLRKMLGEGKRSGEFRDVDPRFLEIAMVGMCEFFVSAWPIIQDQFGVDADRELLAQQYADFVSTFFVQGLRVHDRSPLPAPGKARRAPAKRTASRAR